MKGIVIYKGKYGATRQYAEWLGEELRLQVAASNTISPDELKQFDYFILGSSVYIGKLQLAAWLSKNATILAGKKILFFLVAGTPPEETEKLMGYIKKGIPALLLPSCQYYFLHGKLDIGAISWMDRFMLKMGARMAKDPADRVHMLTNYNNVKKENLEPMLEDIREIQEEKMLV